MTRLLQQFGAEGQMSPEDSRNIMLLTMLSKLAVALVISIVATIVLLIS